MENSILIMGQWVSGRLIHTDGLEELIQHSFRLVKEECWLPLTDDQKLKAGLAGVIIFLVESGRTDDHERLVAEIQRTDNINRLLEKKEYDITKIFNGREPINLAKLWEGSNDIPG